MNSPRTIRRGTLALLALLFFGLIGAAFTTRYTAVNCPTPPRVYPERGGCYVLDRWTGRISYEPAQR